MRPVCWNIITQIVKKYARDTLIPTILLTNTTFRSSYDLHQESTYKCVESKVKVIFESTHFYVLSGRKK